MMTYDINMIYNEINRLLRIGFIYLKVAIETF